MRMLVQIYWAVNLYELKIHDSHVAQNQVLQPFYTHQLGTSC